MKKLRFFLSTASLVFSHEKSFLIRKSISYIICFLIVAALVKAGNSNQSYSYASYKSKSKIARRHAVERCMQERR